MADSLLTIKKVEEKKISQKGTEGNRLYNHSELIQRTTYANRDGNDIKIISDIRKKKEKKQLKKEVAERMGIPKFGLCSGQPRGSLEPGVIVVSKEEVKIVDRKKDIEQDIGDKLREAISDRKNSVLKEMKDKMEREKSEKLAKLFTSTQPTPVRRHQKKENGIKVSGFNPNYEEHDLKEIFEKIGKVKRVAIPKDWNTGKNKNFAFIEFEQTLHVRDAIEKLNDVSYDGCVINIIALD